MSKKKIRGFTLTTEAYEALGALAKKHDTNRSALVEMLIWTMDKQQPSDIKLAPPQIEFVQEKVG